MQIHNCHGILNKGLFKQYKNVNIANFVYYGKTRLRSSWYLPNDVRCYSYKK